MSAENFKRPGSNAPVPVSTRPSLGEYAQGMGVNTVMGLGLNSALLAGGGLLVRRRLPQLSKMLTGAAKEGVTFLDPRRFYKTMKGLPAASELFTRQMKMSEAGLRAATAARSGGSPVRAGATAAAADPKIMSDAGKFLDDVDNFKKLHGEAPEALLERGLGQLSGATSLLGAVGGYGASEVFSEASRQLKTANFMNKYATSYLEALMKKLEELKPRSKRPQAEQLNSTGIAGTAKDLLMSPSSDTMKNRMAKARAMAEVSGAEIPNIIANPTKSEFNNIAGGAGIGGVLALIRRRGLLGLLGHSVTGMAAGLTKARIDRTRGVRDINKSYDTVKHLNPMAAFPTSEYGSPEWKGEMEVFKRTHAGK